jgi:hypothetical protein
MPRRSTRFLIYWTTLAAVPVIYLLARAMEPVHPRCREWCDLNITVAVAVIPLILLIWLAVTAVVLWLRDKA